MRQIAVLGSTGSIGTQTLQIVEQFPDRFRVVALAAGRNIDLLAAQIERFSPKLVSVSGSEDASRLAERFPGLEILHGDAGSREVAALPDADVVVLGISGFAGLAPTLAAVRAGKLVALANKESVITAGHLLREEAARSEASVIPVDSEHNALYQLLGAHGRETVSTIVITASGGPFWKRPELDWDAVTPEMAIRHPNWSMGAKISVDSATLMNKGLELIEAHYLFDFPAERIEIWVHPQSLVHGALWFHDNSCVAQLNRPDMRCSIGYAMGYPERLPDLIPKLSFRELACMEFFAPDDRRFPCPRLAREALARGPSAVVTLNALNEIAVDAFLRGRIGFAAIPRLIGRGLSAHREIPLRGIEDVFAADAEARRSADALLAGQ